MHSLHEHESVCACGVWCAGSVSVSAYPYSRYSICIVYMGMHVCVYMCCVLWSERNHGLRWRAARALVHKQLRARLGLQDCRFSFTGAAPVQLETLDFFLSLGVPLLEIFGLSESSGTCLSHTIRLRLLLLCLTGAPSSCLFPSSRVSSAL